jgi:flagellin FlaB
MKKIFKKLKLNKHGAVGIGAMIVFIAMVLVAGIAASVLVQTANKLEIQAMQTGRQTIHEVASGLQVTGVTGQKGTYDYTSKGGSDVSTAAVLNMTIAVTPRAGSNDIDLSKAVVEFSDSDIKCILTYDTDQANYSASPSTSGIFSTANCFNLNASVFGIIKLVDSDSSVTEDAPVINRGDHVLITLSPGVCFAGLQERDEVWGQVIPEEGAPGIFAFRTPALYSDTVYDLY